MKLSLSFILKELGNDNLKRGEIIIGGLELILPLFNASIVPTTFWLSVSIIFPLTSKKQEGQPHILYPLRKTNEYLFSFLSLKISI